MLARIRDWHQNLSWNAGYRQAMRERPFHLPWWVDREIFGLAYIQGMTGEKIITEEMVAEEENRASETKDLLSSVQRSSRKAR